MATEFIIGVDPNGVEGEYTDIRLAEAAYQVDLTAATTQVFSHSGGSGALGNWNLVTGADSGATGRVRDTSTSTQILLHDVVGTFQSGELIESGANNLTITDAGDTVKMVYECYSGTDSGDVLAVGGWTCDADHFITIRAAAGHEHNGVPGAGYKIKRNSGTGSAALYLQEPYTVVQDIEIENYAVDSNTVQLSSAGSSVFERCIIDHSLGLGSWAMIIDKFSPTVLVRNCLLLSATFGLSLSLEPTRNHVIENCTVIGDLGDKGITYGTAGMTVKNTVVYGFTTPFANWGATATYCAHDSTTPTGEGMVTSITSDVFHDYTNGSYLPSSDGALYDAGDAASAPADDLSGATRVTEEIGAFAWRKATEFVNTMGTLLSENYSTFTDWEAATQCDLTVATTMVFSHGGTTNGPFTNSETVNFTSGGSGSVVGFVTETQMLLDGVTGTINVSDTATGVTSGASVVVSDTGAFPLATCQFANETFVQDPQIAAWETTVDNYIVLRAIAGGEWDPITETGCRSYKNAPSGADIYEHVHIYDMAWGTLSYQTPIVWRDGAEGSTLKRCTFYTSGGFVGSGGGRFDHHYENCLLVTNNADDGTIWYALTCNNCTIVGIDNTAAVRSAYFRNAVCYNCVEYHVFVDRAYAYTNCTGDFNAWSPYTLGAAPPGSNNQADITSDVFVDFDGGDYRAKIGEALANTGTDLSNLFTDDLLGEPR